MFFRINKFINVYNLRDEDEKYSESYVAISQYIRINNNFN